MTSGVYSKAALLREHSQFEEHKMPESVPFAMAQIAAAAAAAPQGKVYEIRPLNGNQNDANLLRMWPAFEKALWDKRISAAPKNAQEVRSWLQSHPRELSLLQSLNFSGLGLTAIPREFLELPLDNLLVLSFDENAIRELPADFGRNLPKLQRLFLNGNQLEQLPAFFGAHLPNIKLLDLSSNRIAFLDYRFIDYWRELEELYLQNNRLPGLMPKLGKNWPKIRVIDLSGNQIKSVPQELRERWPLLEDAALKGNPVQLRKDRIIQKAMSCPEVRAVYEKARKIFPFEIRFEKPPSMLDGECSQSRNAIFVNPDMSDDRMLSVLVFEMINALQMDRFKMVSLEAVRGKIDRDAFAKKFEEIEYQGGLYFRRIMQWAIKNLGWSPSVDTWKDAPDSFDAFWPILKDSGHANLYRGAYDKLVRFMKPVAKG